MQAVWQGLCLGVERQYASMPTHLETPSELYLHPLNGLTHACRTHTVSGQPGKSKNCLAEQAPFLIEVGQEGSESTFADQSQYIIQLGGHHSMQQSNQAL